MRQADSSPALQGLTGCACDGGGSEDGPAGAAGSSANWHGRLRHPPTKPVELSTLGLNQVTFYVRSCSEMTQFARVKVQNAGGELAYAAGIRFCWGRMLGLVAWAHPPGLSGRPCLWS